jgi:hypothetical protein
MQRSNVLLSNRGHDLTKPKPSSFNKKQNFFPVIAGGMLVGALFGGFLFYQLDTTKGWNPYGWWFAATFASTVLGGFVALFLFHNLSSKSPN